MRSAIVGRCGIAVVGAPDGRGELRRDGKWLTAQGQQDRLECPDPAPSRRFDDGAHVGMELRAPDRSEAVGDLAEDRTPAQRLLRAVVGGRGIWLDEEDEQLVLPPDRLRRNVSATGLPAIGSATVSESARKCRQKKAASTPGPYRRVRRS